MLVGGRDARHRPASSVLTQRRELGERADHRHAGRRGRPLVAGHEHGPQPGRERALHVLPRRVAGVQRGARAARRPARARARRWRASGLACPISADATAASTSGARPVSASRSCSEWSQLDTTTIDQAARAQRPSGRARRRDRRGSAARPAARRSAPPRRRRRRAPGASPPRCARRRSASETGVAALVQMRAVVGDLGLDRRLRRLRRDLDPQPLAQRGAQQRRRRLEVHERAEGIEEHGAGTLRHAHDSRHRQGVLGGERRVDLRRRHDGAGVPARLPRRPRLPAARRAAGQLARARRRVARDRDAAALRAPLHLRRDPADRPRARAVAVLRASTGSRPASWPPAWSPPRSSASPPARRWPTSWPG